MQQLDPLTIFAAGGVACMLVERFVYYTSKYKNRNNNPGKYGEKIAKLETKVEELEKSNDENHELIRKDIRKIFNLIKGMRK